MRVVSRSAFLFTGAWPVLTCENSYGRLNHTLVGRSGVSAVRAAYAHRF